MPSILVIFIVLVPLIFGHSGERKNNETEIRMVLGGKSDNKTVQRNVSRLSAVSLLCVTNLATKKRVTWYRTENGTSLWKGFTYFANDEWKLGNTNYTRMTEGERDGSNDTVSVRFNSIQQEDSGVWQCGYYDNGLKKNVLSSGVNISVLAGGNDVDTTTVGRTDGATTTERAVGSTTVGRAAGATHFGATTMRRAAGSTSGGSAVGVTTSERASISSSGGKPFGATTVGRAVGATSVGGTPSASTGASKAQEPSESRSSSKSIYFYTAIALSCALILFLASCIGYLAVRRSKRRDKKCGIRKEQSRQDNNNCMVDNPVYASYNETSQDVKASASSDHAADIENDPAYADCVPTSTTEGENRATTSDVYSVVNKRPQCMTSQTGGEQASGDVYSVVQKHPKSGTLSDGNFREGPHSGAADGASSTVDGDVYSVVQK